VVLEGRTVLSAGSELRGTIAVVQSVGLGFRRQTASLALDFRSIRLATGEELAIDTRMKRVETAKEGVDPGGRIHGIRPVTNVSSSLAVAAWRLLVVAPGVGLAVWATKLLFAPAPDTEITFARGTEYRLELVRPLNLNETDSPVSGLPTRLLTPETRTEAQAVMDALPSQRAERVSGKPSDLVNLIILGPGAAVARAFHAAGWLTSDPKATGSVLRSYFSIVLRRGYRNAPMATMLWDGNRPDIELQKSLDTFAKRHHVRIWRAPRTTPGESAWIATATEDTGIGFSAQAGNFTHFTHVIDGNVDTERTKVVDDLLYTGCVSEAGLIERDNLPADLETVTGARIQTDGRVVALRIGECAEPRAMPGAGAAEQTGFLRFLEAAGRNEIVRSNFLSLAFNGVRLTSATRTTLFGRPLRDNTGAALTRQQVAWLAER
jgi:hypothetical protein